MTSLAFLIGSPNYKSKRVSELFCRRSHIFSKKIRETSFVLHAKNKKKLISDDFLSNIDFEGDKVASESVSSAALKTVKVKGNKNNVNISEGVSNEDMSPSPLIKENPPDQRLMPPHPARYPGMSMDTILWLRTGFLTNKLPPVI